MDSQVSLKKRRQVKDKRSTLDGVNYYDVKPGLIFYDDDLKDTKLYKLIEHQGWLSFCRFESHYYPDFIIEFYQNLKLDRTRTNFVIRTKIRDENISICEATISKLFQLPLKGLCFYSSRKWPSQDVEMNECFQRLSHGRPYELSKPSKTYLKGDERLVLKAITDILLPAHTNDTDLSYMHAFILDCILREVELNLPKLMMLHMESVSNDKSKTTLVYGMAITALLEEKGLIPTAPLKFFKYLNAASITRQQLVKYGGDLLFKWEVEELAPEAQAKLKPKPKIPLSSLSDQSLSEKIYPELVCMSKKLNEILLSGNTLATMDQETHRLLQNIYLEQQSINEKLNEILQLRMIRL